jgi:hypothetical protein
VSAANSAAVRANQQKLEAKRQREQKKLEADRRTAEAIRIVRENAPELAALRNAVTVLRDFVANANAYRPKFTLPSDTKFREVRFSFPFDFFFPRRDCEGFGDGPDPEPWVTTVDLLVPRAHELRSIYKACLNTSTFTCTSPMIPGFDPASLPEYPLIELPLSDIKKDADRTFLIRLRKLFSLKLSRAWKLQEAANQLQNELAEQRRKAEWPAPGLDDTRLS